MSYGIDLGTTNLKVVGLGRTLRGWRMTAAARRRLPSADPKAAALKLLHESIGGPDGRRAGVVGLSGRDINLQIVHQPAMKPVNYRVMMGYELEQRRGETTDLYLDFCTLREPDPYFPQYLALLGTGKSSYVDDRIDLLSRAGLDVRDAVPNSFALFECWRNAYGNETGTILLLDIGSDNMDLAFVRAGRLLFARNVSSGARVFDNQISGLMSLEGDAAEALKIERATLGAPTTDAEAEDELRGPVRSAAGQLAGFITSSINFARTQLNDRELAVDKIYLSGGGARLTGLPEYLQGALKAPVEILDPFRTVDTSAVGAAGTSDVRQLPSDLAVAVGLAQLVSPPASAAERTLSILPDALKKRRRFLRTWLWMSAAAAMVGGVLLVLTVLAVVRRSQERSELERFSAKTADVRRRMDDMKATASEQRDLLARADVMQSYLGGGRALLDVMARLRKAVPAQGMAVSGFHLGGARRDDGGDRVRAAFVLKRRGAVTGEVESESSEQLKLAGHAEPYPLSDIEGEISRWPSGVRSLVVAGDVDENIRGGAREALIALRDQLTDASRGVRASIRSQRASSRPGWRSFELVVDFE